MGPFVPILPTDFDLSRKSRNDPAGRLKRGTIVAAAVVSAEASEEASSLISLVVAGLV